MNSKTKKYFSAYIVFALIAACIVILSSIYLGSLGLPYVLAYLVAINLTAFCFYGYDKLIAGRSMTRIPEWVLHGIAISGGSPTALLSQKLFRHKTAKKSFQIVYWLIVFVQIAILIYIYLIR